MLKAIAVCCCSLLLACHAQTAWRSAPSPMAERVFESVRNQMLQRHQLAAQVTVHLDSVARYLMPTVDVDLAVQSPSSVYVAIRSFFSQPVHTFATDGSRPVDHILPIKLSAEDAVNLFLGRFSERAVLESMESDTVDGRFQLHLRDPKQRHITLVVRMSDNLIQSVCVSDEKDQLVYAVDYEEKRWRIRSILDNKEVRVDLKGISVELNGEAFPPSLFVPEASVE